MDFISALRFVVWLVYRDRGTRSRSIRRIVEPIGQPPLILPSSLAFLGGLGSEDESSCPSSPAYRPAAQRDSAYQSYRFASLGPCVGSGLLDFKGLGL